VWLLWRRLLLLRHAIVGLHLSLVLHLRVLHAPTIPWPHLSSGVGGASVHVVLVVRGLGEGRRLRVMHRVHGHTRVASSVPPMGHPGAVGGVAGLHAALVDEFTAVLVCAMHASMLGHPHSWAHPHAAVIHVLVVG